jgi:hypothetical protein
VRHTRPLARTCAATLALAALLLAPAPAAPQKMKPEELVAKHLDSIGTADARAAARNRIATGTSVLVVRQGGAGNLAGSALMASDGTKNLIIMAFDSPDIPAEKFGFNGSKFSVSTIRPGERTPLGEFFRTHDVMFKEGLVGGTITEAWPLLRLAERNPKLEYGGTKKVGDRQAHELKYTPRKGSDLKIRLYFDAENFRHIRTEYERTVAATMGAAPGLSAGRIDTRYRVVEEFSNFKEENGLTLPHTYKLELRVTGENVARLLDWAIELNKFTFNQTMSDKDFDVEAN